MENKDQISTKEFLKSVLDYLQFLGKKWQILLIALIIGSIYDIARFNFFDRYEKYGGLTQFNIDLESSGATQMGGLASAFGFGGSTTTGGILEMSNFPKIIMSRTIFQKALLTEVDLFDRKDLFINFFIDSSDIKHKEWKGNFFRSPSPFSEYKFTPKESGEISIYENQIIDNIYLKLKDLTNIELEQGTNIYNLTATLTNELLTKAWIETLLKSTEDYYTEIKTTKTRKLIDIQQKRVDSLRYQLSRTDRGLAQATFDQPDAVNPFVGVTQNKLTRDNAFLSQLYMTNLNNLDNLKYQLAEKEEFFYILTPVTLPLSKGGTFGISLRLSGLILLVAVIFILTIKRAFTNILNEEE